MKGLNGWNEAKRLNDLNVFYLFTAGTGGTGCARNVFSGSSR